MKLGSTIFILGSGGFARELKTYLQSYNVKHANFRSYEIQKAKAFSIYLVAPDGDITVKEYHAMLNKLMVGNYYSIMGSGQCDVKLRMLEEIRKPYLSFIHPAAIVLPESVIGMGSVIAPSAVIAPRVILGEHVLVNYGASIGHDTTVGNMSVISPNATVGGTCSIGNSVYIGSGSSIKENITIGDNSLVAMGAVVVKDVPSNHIAIGVPAKMMPLHEWKSTTSN